MNDMIICYFNDFKELSEYLNYKVYDLVREFDRRNSDIINVIIDNKKYRLATFC